MRKQVLYFTALVALGVACAIVVHEAAAASPTLDRIKERGAIVLSYRNGAPPFSFKDR